MKIEKIIHLNEDFAAVGKFNSCKVGVYGKEGPIPHFHIERSDGEKCCIRIDKAEYFNHGDEKKYKLKFNSVERKELVNWLCSKSDLYKALDIDLSIYRNIVLLWNQNNPHYTIDLNIEMPNYKELL